MRNGCLREMVAYEMVAYEMVASRKRTLATQTKHAIVISILQVLTGVENPGKITGFSQYNSAQINGKSAVVKKTTRLSSESTMQRFVSFACRRRIKFTLPF
jgi:hypothetical protein